jgi:hypothetical protein
MLALEISAALLHLPEKLISALSEQHLLLRMARELYLAKYATHAITKVMRVNNTLQFISAKNLDIPKRVILLQNLKSIDVYNGVGEYTLLFNYLSQNEQKGDTERVNLIYTCSDGHNWEEEAKKVINETMRLL